MRNVEFTTTSHKVNLAYLQEYDKIAVRFSCAFQCGSHIFVLMDEGKEYYGKKGPKFLLDGNFLFKTTNIDMHKYTRGIPDPTEHILTGRYRTIRLLAYDQNAFVFLYDHANKLQLRYYDPSITALDEIHIFVHADYSDFDIEKNELTRNDFFCVMNNSAILLLTKYHQRDEMFSRLYVFDRRNLRNISIIRNVYYATIRNAVSFHIFYGPMVKPDRFLDDIRGEEVDSLDDWSWAHWAPGEAYDPDEWVRLSDKEYGVRRKHVLKNYEDSDLTVYDDTQWIILSLSDLKKYGRRRAHRLHAHLTVDGGQVTMESPSLEQQDYAKYTFVPNEAEFKRGCEKLTEKLFYGPYGLHMPPFIDDAGRLMRLSMDLEKTPGNLKKEVAYKEQNSKTLDLVSSEFHN